MESILKEELKEGLEKIKRSDKNKFIDLTKTFNNYLSDKSKEVMCKKAYHTIVETWDDFPDGERKWNPVQYVGVTKTILDKKCFEQEILDGIKHVAELINYCVKKEYVFYGFLVPCVMVYLKPINFNDRVLILSYPVTRQDFGDLGKRLIKDGKMSGGIKAEVELL